MIKNENIRVLLLYVTLICVLYAPVVFLGKSLIPSLSYPYGITEYSPSGYQGRKPLNVFNIDLATPAYYNFPINKLVGKLYLSGKLPLWNPYQACGTPLAAQYSSRVFFPYQILEDILPYYFWDYFILGRLLIAAFFTYLFLRTLSVSVSCAFLGGVFYAFSGTFTWFATLEDFVNVAMMVPVLLFSFEMLIKTKAHFYIGISAIALALSILAGQPEVTLYQLLFVACYLVFRVMMMKGYLERLKHLARAFITVILGFGISSVLIFLFIEFAFTNASFHAHGLGGTMGIQSPTPIYHLISIVLPTIFRIPTFYRITPQNGVWDFLGGYSGTVVMFSILLGLFLRNHQNWKFFLFFFFSGLFIILKNVGLPIISWIGYLPFLNQVWTNRWAGPIWTFSFAIAGAIGIENFLSLIQSGEKGQIKRVIFLGMGLVAFVFSLTFNPFFKEVLSTEHYPVIDTLKILIIVMQILIGVGAVIFLTRTEFFITGSSRGFFAVSLISFFMLFSFLLRLAIAQFDRFYLPSLDSSQQNFFTICALGAMSMSFIIVVAITILYRRRNSSDFLSGIIALSVVEFWIAIPRGYDIKGVYFEYIIFVISIILILITRKKFMVMAFVLIVIATCLFDIKVSSGLPDRYDPFKKVPYIDFLKKQKGHFRGMASDGILMPNFSSAMELSDVRYINALAVKSYHEYTGKFLDNRNHAVAFYTGKLKLSYSYASTTTFPVISTRARNWLQDKFRLNKAHKTNLNFLWLWFTGIPDVIGNKKAMEQFPEIIEARRIENTLEKGLPYYSLLGVRFFLVPSSVDLNRNLRIHLPLVYNKEIKIYENPFALPRAFVAHNVENASCNEEAIVKVKKEAAQLIKKNKVILEGSAHLSSSVGIQGTLSEVEINKYCPNKIILHAKLDSPGVLVLSDTYYPGWTAFVDDKYATIYRANAIMRAIFLKEGEHKIVFRYSPKSFKWGVAVSAISFIIVMIFLVNRNIKWKM